MPRILRQKINRILYERTVLSRKPGKLAAVELKLLREEDCESLYNVAEENRLEAKNWKERAGALPSEAPWPPFRTISANSFRLVSA